MELLKKLSKKTVIRVVFNNYFLNKELLYGNIFKDTICESDWLIKKDFSLHAGAASYCLMYHLYRILDEIQPKNILELGLGQTTKMTSQYAEFNHDARVFVVDDNNEWIDTFSNKLSSTDNCTLNYVPSEIFNYKNSENKRYKDLKNHVKDEKFDLIIIDGPNGFIGNKFCKYSRSNIWDLIENNVAKDFIIIIDDSERAGEMNTINHLEKILQKKNIKFYSMYCYSLSDIYIICSERYKFVTWF